MAILHVYRWWVDGQARDGRWARGAPERVSTLQWTVRPMNPASEVTPRSHALASLRSEPKDTGAGWRKSGGAAKWVERGHRWVERGHRGAEAHGPCIGVVVCSAERPPVRWQSGGAAPRAAACGGVRRPLLVTGRGPCWITGQWPVEIRVGLEGGGPVSPPGCLRCGPLTAGRPLSLAAVDRGSLPRSLSRLWMLLTPAFALSSHYMQPPLGIASQRELRTALRALRRGMPASPGARPGRGQGAEIGDVKLAVTREFTPARKERGSGNGRPNEGRGAVGRAGESGLRDRGASTNDTILHRCWCSWPSSSSPGQWSTGA
jgi:hypothetical protein